MGRDGQGSARYLELSLRLPCQLARPSPFNRSCCCCRTTTTELHALGTQALNPQSHGQQTPGADQELPQLFSIRCPVAPAGPSLRPPPPPFLRTCIDSTKRQRHTHTSTLFSCQHLLLSDAVWFFFFTLPPFSLSPGLQRLDAPAESQSDSQTSSTLFPPLPTTRPSIPVYFQSSPGQHPHPTLHPTRKRYVL